jgi:hypothetical protein
MKRLIIIIIVLFFGSSVFAQDSLAYLQKAWKGLGMQYHRRNEVLLVLSERIKGIDSIAVVNIRTKVNSMDQFIDTETTLDSLLVATFLEKNRAVTSALGQAFVVLEAHPDIKNNEEVKNLIGILMGTENRCNATKTRYNELCLNYKRKDLYLP